MNDLEWAHSVYFVKLIIRYRALTGGYIGGYPPRKLRAVLKGIICPRMDQRTINCRNCSLKETCRFSSLLADVSGRDYLPYFLGVGNDSAWKGQIIPGSLHTFDYCIAGEKIQLIEDIESGLRQKSYIFLDAVDPQKIYFELDSIHKVNEGRPINLRYLLDYYKEKCAVDISEIQQITLEFLTPLCLKYSSETVKEPKKMSFQVFVHKLIERIKMLAESHCAFSGSCPEAAEVGALCLGGKEMRHPDFRFVNTKAYKKNGAEYIGGFKGRLSFEGDLTPFFPLIVLGEALHIGNDTTQGHGKYSIVEVNSKQKDFKQKLNGNLRRHIDE